MTIVTGRDTIIHGNIDMTVVTGNDRNTDFTVINTRNNADYLLQG
jgi:hypothetical protein